jgi:hypothetical protein
MGVVYKQGRYLSLAARSFVQELQDYFAPEAQPVTVEGRH